MNRREAIKSLALLPMALSMKPQPETQYKACMRWENKDGIIQLIYELYCVEGEKTTNLIPICITKCQLNNGFFNIAVNANTHDFHTWHEKITKIIPIDAKFYFYSNREGIEVFIKYWEEFLRNSPAGSRWQESDIKRQSHELAERLIQGNFKTYQGVEITPDHELVLKFK